MYESWEAQEQARTNLRQAIDEYVAIMYRYTRDFRGVSIDGSETEVCASTTTLAQAMIEDATLELAQAEYLAA